MMIDVESLIQDICMLGGGGASRYATRLVLHQVLSHGCYYDLTHRIAATVGPSLAVVADMPLQSYYQELGHFRDKIFRKFIKRAAQIKVTWRDDGKWNDHKLE